MRKQEEMKDKREDEVEKRKQSKPLSAVQWNAVSSASAVDDREQWKSKLGTVLVTR